LENNNVTRTDVNKLGEFGLINHLTKDVVKYQSSTIKAIGDDAAVIGIGEGKSMIISTDLMVEGIHFDLVYTPLAHLGYKAVIINLSDICAMNAKPSHITVSIAISNKYSVEALEELYKGINLACKLYEVDLVGGDTTSSPKGMTISVTAVGFADTNKISFRSGAKPGDIICATGDYGAAYIGLQILEREKQLFFDNPDLKPELEQNSYVLSRFLKPEARLDAVRYFEKNNIVPTSMIDVSDGLASEVMHICNESNVGAFIEEGKVPINPDVEELALEFKMNPIVCALNGGEDYELLFTIDEKDLEKIRYMPEVFILGEIVDKKDGITLHTTSGNIHPIEAQGWVHFKE
jgi:thiamine-monophosphate kinase